MADTLLSTDLRLVDTHCHLDEDSFKANRDETIQRAVDSGIVAMVTIGTTLASSRMAIELAANYDAVYAAVGIHPNYAATAAEGDWQEIEQLCTAPKVVAVGETGLDRYWDHTPIEIQQDYFDRHLTLSRSSGLPFIVHCRDAEADVVAQLQRASEAGPLNGVMHSFCGSAETARICLDLGLYLSFSGMLTFRRNEALRALVGDVPLDRLLVETDAPYLSPSPHRDKRNEPANVRFTAECLATARGVISEELCRTTTANAIRLFKLPLGD